MNSQFWSIEPRVSDRNKTFDQWTHFPRISEICLKNRALSQKFWESAVLTRKFALDLLRTYMRQLLHTQHQCLLFNSSWNLGMKSSCFHAFRGYNSVIFQDIKIIFGSTPHFRGQGIQWRHCLIQFPTFAFHKNFNLKKSAKKLPWGISEMLQTDS